MTFFAPRSRFLAIALLAAAFVAPAFTSDADEGKPAWADLKTGVKHRVMAADSSKTRIALFAEDGSMEWERPIADLHDFTALENGNILLQSGWTRVVEITPKGDEVWSFDIAKMKENADKNVQVHAFQRLADGATMIAMTGPGRIIEVEKDGEVRSRIALKVENPDPHRDTRLARNLPNGHYLVCHEGDGVVREYDAAGAVVWDFAIPGDKGFSHEGTGTAVFGAIRKPNGNTVIATGNGHSVVEVTPEKKIIWELTEKDMPGFHLAWVTTLELLPNGNLVVGNCHAGPGVPQIIEVTPEKKLVWAFYDFERLGDSTTNSQLYDLRGKTIR